MSNSLKAIQALQEERLEEYKSYLEQALAEDNENDLYLLADSLYQLGFLQDTKRVLEKLLKSNPGDDELRINLAEIAIEEDEDLEAFDLLSQIDESSAVYVQSLLVLADYYQVQDLPEVSEQKLLEAKKIVPEEPVITFALGELYYTMGRYTQAIRQYEDLYEKGHDEVAAVQMAARLGASYSATGDFENAAGYLEEALEQKEHIDTIFQLGLTYFQQEEFSRAAESFYRVKSLDESYTSLYPFLARALEEEQRLDDAAEIISEGLYLDKTNSQLYVIGANIEVKRGNLETSREYFEEALSKNPDNEATRIEYSNFLNYIEEYEKSIELIQDALRNQDADPQLYWNLATAQQELEEYEAAARAFEKAYPFFDNNADFLREYIDFLQEEGASDKLKEAARKYLEIQPDDLEIIELLNRYEDLE